MTRLSRGLCVFPVCLAALLLVGGCGEGDGDDQEDQSPPGVAGGARGGGAPGGGGPGSPGIRQIMAKLTKGPNSLTPVIGNELDQDPPPWETIQGQTKEYSQSASELGKYDPPKGAKDSWIKLTAAFAELASELDHAAVAKNKETAKVAHDQLKNSCNACHQEHRRMGRGGGGGPMGFGPRGGRGGPPPGGPGGQPPGGPGGPPPGGPE
jgi:hypothetical protein